MLLAQANDFNGNDDDDFFVMMTMISMIMMMMQAMMAMTMVKITMPWSKKWSCQHFALKAPHSD